MTLPDLLYFTINLLPQLEHLRGTAAHTQIGRILTLAFIVHLKCLEEN